MDLELNKVVEAILGGLAIRGDGRARCGCGRAYVCFSKRIDRKNLNIIKKALEQCRINYIGKAYGAGDRSAYIGYDNGNGVPLSQAEAISDRLRLLGIDCYAEGVGD